MFSSAHVEHVPFYFWLVDAARPRLIIDLAAEDSDAYLAFCQAAERLDFGTRCIGLSDVFNRRDSASDPASNLAYHNLHFSSFSKLTNQNEIIESARPGSVDLLRIGGRQASHLTEAEVRGWLDLLSPKGLVLVEQTHVQHDWLKLLEGKASCPLHGNTDWRLIAATADYDSRLSPLFSDTSTKAKSVRMTFSRLGSGLREQAMHRDIASFAAQLEISLADQSAAAELLREKEALAESLQSKISLLERDQLQSRLETDRLQKLASQRELELVETNAQFRQVLDQRELELAQANLRFQKILDERDLELTQASARLQNLVDEHDLEAKRRSEELLSASRYAALQDERLDQSVRNQDELRRHISSLEHNLNAIIRSTTWRVTAPIRKLAQVSPKTARLFRRGLKLAWWTVSLELPSRLREWRRRRQPAHVAVIANPAPMSSPPAATPDNASNSANPLRRALTGSDYSSTQIQYVENRLAELSSLVDMERRRVDHALLAAEGMSNEIELYHNARREAEYRKAFDQPAPLVSICVATVNRSDLLIERCLKSLLNQSYRNIQIVVCGDHCTDDTGSRIALLRDDRVSFHNLPQRGPYPPPGIDRWRVAGTNAINAALAMCEGQFIAHLDDDDSATADRIETMLNAAQTHKADFCWHSFWNERKDGGWNKLGDGRLELGQITTGSTFYHRYFSRIRWDVLAYRTQEPGDWNRLRKIRSLRPNLHFVDRPLMFHYTEGNQPPFVRFDGETFLG